MQKKDEKKSHIINYDIKIFIYDSFTYENIATAAQFLTQRWMLRKVSTREHHSPMNSEVFPLVTNMKWASSCTDLHFALI